MNRVAPMSAFFRCVHTVVLLQLVVTCSRPLLASSAALRGLSYPYSSIFSPLLRALSEHGPAGWNSSLRRKAKPDHRDMDYLTQVYRSSASRLRRSADGNEDYNMVRLIKPQDECLAHSHKESCMQDLSYSLDQVRRKEQLLKSALLYSFDFDGSAPTNSTCFLSVKEQEESNQCQVCPVIQLAVNFTNGGRSWVQVDVTSFFQPLLKFHRKNLHLLINITCSEDPGVLGNGRRGPLGFILRPPPLLLYLNDTSKTEQQKSLVDTKAAEMPSAALNTFHKQVVLKPEQRFVHKRRWKRHSPTSHRGDKHLRSCSALQTGYCALYDFRVGFSELELDDWIVYPRNYNPRYCHGSCPRTVDFLCHSPIHTMVQNIIYEELDDSVPRPSCIPSHYRPLTVIIFEEDGSFVCKDLEDMVATSCTCR